MAPKEKNGQVTKSLGVQRATSFTLTQINVTIALLSLDLAIIESKVIKYLHKVFHSLKMSFYDVGFKVGVFGHQCFMQKWWIITPFCG